MRLVLITRRYWPLVGGAEIAMARLATAFADRGHAVTVLTAAWHADWPRQVIHRGVPVTRIPQSPARWRGTWQYMRGISRWLRTHRSEFDAVLVSMLKHSAHVAVGEGKRSRFPVVLRAEGGGDTGDCRFQETARFGKRIRQRCQLADAVIAPADSVADELLIAGYDRRRIVTIANGVPIPSSVTPRDEAREALADIHIDLQLASDAPLVVYAGRLDEAKGLRELVMAWKKVVAAQTRAMLWLIGDGPYRDSLFRLVKDEDLLSSVRMPGTFDDVSEVLAAADLFVLPSHVEGLSLSLLEAMAHAVPVIASDIPGNRQVIGSPEQGRLVPVRDIDELAASIIAVLANPLRAGTMGAAGRERVRDGFSLDRMAEEHLRVIAESLKFEV